MEKSTQMTSSQAAKHTSTNALDAWLMEKITMADLLKPGTPVLNSTALDFLLERYTKLVSEIGTSRFEAAYLAVFDNSKFRPDIAEIRLAAGMDRNSLDPAGVQAKVLEAEALAELRKVIEAMRDFGPLLRPRLGAILNDGRDERGVILSVPMRAPTSHPPAFAERTEAALVEMGFGSRVAGLEMLCAHPSLPQLEAEPAFTMQRARDVERRWVEAYRK